MRLKNTILLVLIAVALFAFIKIYESKQLTTAEAEERAGKVAIFDRDKIYAISIKNTETKIELRKQDDGSWRLTEPARDRADLTAVSQLFTVAESLRYDAVIGDSKKGADKDQLKDFGLTNSATKLKLAGDGEPVELLFGKDTAVEGKVYAKRDDTNIVYVIGRELKELISKKSDDFRDRRLTHLDPLQVDRITINSSAGEIEAIKKDGHWSLTKPLKARGDDSKITDLVSQAATAHIAEFLSEIENPAAYGLQEPKATVSLYQQDESNPVILQLGGHPTAGKDKGNYYAKLSTRDSLLVLSASVETLLSTKPNDLRDRSLIRVEADIIDRILIVGKRKEKVVIARSGESWVRKTGEKDVAINVGAARQLLDQLRSQQVAAFIADVGTDLASYGLDRPQAEVTLSSYSSENTAETKAGDKPIVTVIFGNVENGSAYAKLEDEPFIVSVPQAIMDYVMSDPLQWQPLEIYRGKAEDITAIEVTKEGQPAISLERNKDQAWVLAKGDGTVNQINVQSLVNTLASLRAVRWIGPSQPEHGLESPRIVVSFKTTANTGGRLTLGNASSEDFTFARAEGSEGTFAVNRPDSTVFTLPLIDTAAAQAATPVPSATLPSEPLNGGVKSP